MKWSISAILGLICFFYFLGIFIRSHIYVVLFTLTTYMYLYCFACVFCCFFSVYSVADSCEPGYEGNPLVPGDYCRMGDGNPHTEGLHCVCTFFFLFFSCCFYIFQ